MFTSQPVALATFAQHYISAALQLADEEVGTDATAAELAPEARAVMEAVCAEFFEVALAVGWLSLAESCFKQAGTDFWLSRNGHGAGFFDREELYGEVEARSLQSYAHTFGESYVYRGDDGNVYCYAPEGAGEKILTVDEYEELEYARLRSAECSNGGWLF